MAQEVAHPESDVERLFIGGGAESLLRGGVFKAQIEDEFRKSTERAIGLGLESDEGGGDFKGGLFRESLPKGFLCGDSRGEHSSPRHVTLSQYQVDTYSKPHDSSSSPCAA